MMHKLALGTVQFGLNYGVSNTRGQVKIEEVERILKLAEKEGIDLLDTAHAYGNSENVLGKFDLSKFKIVTKLIGNNRLEDSLVRLNVESIYGLMIHHEDDFDRETWQRFLAYKQQKLVQKIGVSVYTPAILLRLIDEFAIDIVQLPMNIFDQRFLEILPVLQQRNIEVHVRSAFLQGLLLMPSEEIDPFFVPIKKVHSSIPEPKISHALNFLKNRTEIQRIVVGVTCCQELQEIIENYHKEIEYINYDDLKITEERFINPTFWRLKTIK